MAEITILTRAEARARREADDRGHLFQLHRTGGWAHVDPKPVAALALDAGLPLEGQRTVLRVFREMEAEGGPGAGNGTLTWERLARNQQRQLEIADAVCAACFLRPRLVLRAEDLDPADPYCWHVEDLHVEERIRFLNLCNGGEEELRKLEPFPVEGLGGAAAAPAVPAAAAAVGGAGAG